MTLRIITRAEWGARHADGFATLTGPASELWLHHSATIAPDLLPPYDDDYAAVRTLEKIGQERFGGGISYTFAVTPVGLCFQGTSVQRRGAHTHGHNTAGRAIVLVGNYDKNPPTRAQVATVGALIAHGKAQKWWTVSQLTGGHRDAERPGYTECPGEQAERAIREINQAAIGWPVQPAPVPVVKPPAKPGNYLPHDWPLPRDHYLGTPRPDRRCHSGYYSARDREIIAEWQRAMRARGANITVDGRFGPSSSRVAGDFQRRHGLAVDGQVGFVTWRATDVLPGG